MTQPRSLAICLENVEAQRHDRRYLRCVALPGGQPGVTLGEAGQLHWLSDVPAGACELWVAMDEALIARRPKDAITVRLLRAGRSLELPADKPVVLLQDDELVLAGLRLRVHVHGFVDAVSAPEWFVPPLSHGRRGARAVSTAAALAFGAAVSLGAAPESAAGSKKPDKPKIEVRERPPIVARPPKRPPPKPKKPKKPKKPPGKKGVKDKKGAKDNKGAKGKQVK